jgi:hypothetical protein
VWPYKTKGGAQRYAVGHPIIGTRRRDKDTGKGWTKYADAAKALSAMIAAAERGELVEPSRQPLGAYLDEWLAGRRLEPSTRASYAKNIRLSPGRAR